MNNNLTQPNFYSRINLPQNSFTKQGLIPNAYVTQLMGAPEANESILESSLFGANFYAGALTPEALFAYVSTRLQNLDTRVEEVFERQQKTDKVRSVLRQISGELANFDANPKQPDEAISVPPEAMGDGGVPLAITAINSQLEELKGLDAALYKRVSEDLQAVLTELGTDKFTGTELTAAKEQLGNLQKDLDASAQLDMIELQSLTSQRQTAVGLATNLLSNLSETLRSVVANIK